MSTYTDLHVRNKENITILRMPGNPYDGMTQQRVIFANPENIYNGKFVGELSTTSVSFDNVTMTNCEIVDGVISNALLKDGNQAITIRDVIAYTYDISALQTSAESLFSYANTLSDAVDILSDGISAINDISSIAEISSKLDKYIISNENALSIVNDNVDSLSNAISSYIVANDSNMTQVSNDISGLSNDFTSYSSETDEKIQDLYSKTRGGLVCKGTLSIDYIDEGYAHTLQDLFIANNFDSSTQLSTGYFYVAKTLPQNKDKSFEYDGVWLEHGDWLLVKDNCYVSSIVSTDVDVFDAQDYDAFKLSNDNDVYGDNTFNGSTTFNSNAIFNSKADFNALAYFNNGISTTSIYADNVVVENSLSVDLKNVTNGISTLQEISNDIYSKLSSTSNGIKELCSDSKAISAIALENSGDISALSIVVDEHTAKLSNHMTYAGTFENAYEMTPPLLSTFLFENFGYEREYLHKGLQCRFLSTMTLCTATQSMQFYANDYIIFNRDIAVKDVQFSDIDVIRDAQAEGEALLSIINALSSQVGEISISLSDAISAVVSNVYSLSNEVSVASSDIMSSISSTSSYLSSDYSEKINAMSNDITTIVAETSNMAILSANAYTNSQIDALSINNYMLTADFKVLSNEIGLSAASAGNPVVTKDDIKDLAGAMHFRSAITPEESETDAEAIARVVTDPKAGDVVIITTTSKEYVYDGTQWVELGDEVLYATKAEIAIVSAQLTGNVNYLSNQIDASNSTLDIVSSDYLTSADKTELETLVRAVSTETLVSANAYTDEAIDALSIGDYALTNDVLTLISAISSETYASTNAYTDNTIASLSISSYALSADLSNAIASIDSLVAVSSDYKTYNDTISSLSNDGYVTSADSSKVFIKDPEIPEFIDGKLSDLSVIKLSSYEEYAQILQDGAQPNALYIISSDYINAYGQQLRNLADGTLSSDAATYGQLSSTDGKLANVYSKLLNALLSSGLINKQIEDIDLASCISCLYYIAQNIASISSEFTLNTQSIKIY